MTSIDFLLATGLKATILLAVAFLVALTLRRSTAAARYLILTSGLVGVLAIPLLSLSLRPWNVQFSAPPVTPTPVALAADSFTSLPASGGTASAGQNVFPNVFNASLIPLWLCGFAAVMARIAVGHLRVRRSIHRAAKVNDAEWTELLAEVSAQLGLRRQVDLLRGRETDVPLSYGILRPLILLPGESTEWSAERRRVVLLHELIHVQRLDALFCLIAQVSCAAY